MQQSARSVVAGDVEPNTTDSVLACSMDPNLHVLEMLLQNHQPFRELAQTPEPRGNGPQTQWY